MAAEPEPLPREEAASESLPHVEVDWREVRERAECADCGTACRRLACELSRDDRAWAVAYVDLREADDPDAFVEVLLGGWGGKPAPGERVTFTFWLGWQARPGGDEEIGARPADPVRDPADGDAERAAFFGEVVSREGARAHPMLADALHALWSVYGVVDELRDHLGLDDEDGDDDDDDDD